MSAATLIYMLLSQVPPQWMMEIEFYFTPLLVPVSPHKNQWRLSSNAPIRKESHCRQPMRRILQQWIFTCQRHDMVRVRFVPVYFDCNRSSPVYYRVYSTRRDIPSKQPVDPDDPSLGRINVCSIPPPRTVASMRRTISRVEKYPHFLPWHAKLFVNMSSESPMDETHSLDLAGDFPFSVDQPLAFVLPTVILLKSLYTDGMWCSLRKKAYDSVIYRRLVSRCVLPFNCRGRNILYQRYSTKKALEGYRW
jgi:ribosome-associated toxin RatA of RatAB toxin-antitoxin module